MEVIFVDRSGGRIAHASKEKRGGEKKMRASVLAQGDRSNWPFIAGWRRVLYPGVDRKRFQRLSRRLDKLN